MGDYPAGSWQRRRHLVDVIWLTERLAQILIFRSKTAPLQDGRSPIVPNETRNSPLNQVVEGRVAIS